MKSGGRAKMSAFGKLVRYVVLLAFPAALVFGQSERLYLKDGEYQLVREYQIQKDRVRYYSTERSQWEEIPLGTCSVKKHKSS